MIVLGISYLVFLHIKNRFSGYDRLIKWLKRVRGNDTNFMNFGYWKKDTVGLPEANRNLCDFILSKGRLEGVRSILDVGCGYGEQDMYLYPKVKKKITCLDINAKQIAHLKARIKEAGLQDQLVACVGDAVNLPFEDASFDMVWSIESAFHYRPRKAFFKEARRVLRPGGTLLIADILLNRNCPWPVSYIPQIMCKSFFDICEENWEGLPKWREQLVAEGFQIEVEDITEMTFRPYFKAFIEQLIPFGGLDILLWPVAYLISKYFSICTPFSYVVASATKKSTCPENQEH